MFAQHALTNIVDMLTQTVYGLDNNEAGIFFSS